MKSMTRFAWQRRAPVSGAEGPRTRPGAPHVPRTVSVPSQTHTRLPWPVVGSLARRLGLEASQERYCPVELANGSVAILALEDWCDSDQVDELERLLLERGHPLAQPSRLKVTAPLLLAVVRGQVSGDGWADSRVGEGTRSRMADAFLDMVTWGFEHDASDLHINIQSRRVESDVRYTIAGQYVAPARFVGMPTATLQEILAVAWMDVRGGNGAVFDPGMEQQGRIHLDIKGRPVMLRWASLATDAGPSVCLRLLRLDAQVNGGPAELGYLPQQAAMLERATTREGGAVVLAGVVGSGKSTTIAALMTRLPASHKVITLEDPVEYLIPRALQNSVARALDDTEGGAFDAKLKTIKRSAMNDLLLGEVRDRDSGRAFMDLAGSGISVFTTVHAGGALLVPDRLASDFIGVSRDFLATPGVLKLLAYQALLPALCPNCALAEPGAQATAAPTLQSPASGFWQAFGADGPARLRWRNRAGCEACRRPQLPELAGYRGRTVVAEMIEPGADEGFLTHLRRADNLALRRHWRAQRVTALHDPDMRGKTAHECAIYKAGCGLIDPRDIDHRFGPPDDQRRIL